MTGSEVGERGGGEIRKGPQAGIQTRDARITMALYVGVLPSRLLALTCHFNFHYALTFLMFVYYYFFNQT